MTWWLDAVSLGGSGSTGTLGLRSRCAGTIFSKGIKVKPGGGMGWACLLSRNPTEHPDSEAARLAPESRRAALPVVAHYGANVIAVMPSAPLALPPSALPPRPPCPKVTLGGPRRAQALAEHGVTPLDAPSGGLPKNHQTQHLGPNPLAIRSRAPVFLEPSCQLGRTDFLRLALLVRIHHEGGEAF